MLFYISILACSEDVSESLNAGYTSGEGYYVRYDTNPEPIPVNDEFILGVDVFLDDSETERAEGVTVDVDAEMPDHDHGMNVIPVAEEVGPGRFEAEGFLFHMTGYWEIIVYVNGSDGSEDIRFPVTMK